jgi:hypothetical protein
MPELNPYIYTCADHPTLFCPACKWAEEQQPDVTIFNEGALVLFRPISGRAKTWIQGNVETEQWQ